MRSFDKFRLANGDLVDYIYLGFGSIALLVGIILCFLNLRKRKIVEFVSGCYLFGAITFSVGSQVYIAIIKDSRELVAVTLFWSIIGTTAGVSIISGILSVSIKSFNQYGSAVIGLACGLSAMNLFHSVILSDAILLICSVLLGIIVGSMCFVFQDPFEIVVIPCLAYNLIQCGALSSLVSALSLAKIPIRTRIQAENIATYTLLGLCLVLYFLTAFFHYKKYLLKREQLDIDSKVLIKSPSAPSSPLKEFKTPQSQRNQVGPPQTPPKIIIDRPEPIH